MQIFSELSRDHARLRELLGLIESARATERPSALAQFREDWSIHSRAEEDALYRTLLDDDRTHEHVLDGLDDHRSIDQMIDDLEDALENPKTSEWREPFQQLKAEVEHHFDEEESEIFPTVRPSLGLEEALELGEIFEEMRLELRRRQDLRRARDSRADSRKREMSYGPANP